TYLLLLSLSFLFSLLRPPPRPTLFPYTTLFRSWSCDRSPTTATHPPTSTRALASSNPCCWKTRTPISNGFRCPRSGRRTDGRSRSEEHTSELQSRFDLVCRLLLEKKKKKNNN